MNQRTFDIVVVGGGMAGSIFAGVAARSGRGVLVVEREARFRDRVRGEITHPWGVHEAMLLGLEDLFRRAGSMEIPFFREYSGQAPADSFDWRDISVGRRPMIGFSHPGLQETAITWATEQGATVLRPAKVTGVRPALKPQVTIALDDAEGEVEVQATLVVGADGRTSATRRWAGADMESDPEHHRIGGGLFSKSALNGHVFHVAIEQGIAAWAFERSEGLVRVYVVGAGNLIDSKGVDARSNGFLDYVSGAFPAGAFGDARQAGPVAFFSNAESWPTRIAGDHVVVIGDAAGRSDPSRGHGTSLVFRDIRCLIELLEEHQEVQAAIDEFERRRRAYFAPIRAVTTWDNRIKFETGPDAARRWERYLRAGEVDPTRGGFGMIEALGPDGLVVDEGARRRYFGEDLE